MQLLRQKAKTDCKNEYDRLKRVILCEPKHMSIREQMNENQKRYKDVGLHIDIAMKQHQDLVKALKREGIEVYLLPVHSRYPEQVFTRDIGFTIGETIYVAEMAHRARRGEEEILKNWLKQEKISYYNLVADHIEGGDVLIQHQRVYAGLSNRTNQPAINHLQSLLPTYEVITVPFKVKYLHLDCVFNILSEHDALYYPEAFTAREAHLLAEHFDLISVTQAEQFTLGTNVLSLGDKKVLSLPQNRGVNQQLRIRGYEVIEVDISEIIKSGGSFRCCTLPILREA